MKSYRDPQAMREMAALAARNPFRLPGSQAAHDSLMSAVCTLLKLSHVEFSRVNQRPVQTIRGWRCQGADIGFPDIVAILPGGRCWGIECKSGGAVLSQAQKACRERWTAAGALWTTAHDVHDVGEVLAGLKPDALPVLGPYVITKGKTIPNLPRRVG